MEQLRALPLVERYEHERRSTDADLDFLPAITYWQQPNSREDVAHCEIGQAHERPGHPGAVAPSKCGKPWQRHGAARSEQNRRRPARTTFRHLQPSEPPAALE